MLELKNIKKAFGDCVANEDVSLTVHKGAIHAIVGENGAGKSTAMKVVYGFYNPDHGEIIFNDKPVTIRLTVSGFYNTVYRVELSGKSE